MDSRTISEEYQKIGHRIIEEMPELADLRDSDVSIIFLSSEHEKKEGGKRIFGQCEKVAEKYKWGIPCDFTITLFEPNIEDFTDKQIEILIFHELLHIGIDGNKLSIRPHDLEDFKTIIEKYGTNWSEV